MKKWNNIVDANRKCTKKIKKKERVGRTGDNDGKENHYCYIVSINTHSSGEQKKKKKNAAATHAAATYAAAAAAAADTTTASTRQ